MSFKRLTFILVWIPRRFHLRNRKSLLDEALEGRKCSRRVRILIAETSRIHRRSISKAGKLGKQTFRYIPVTRFHAKGELCSVLRCCITHTDIVSPAVFPSRVFTFSLDVPYVLPGEQYPGTSHASTTSFMKNRESWMFTARRGCTAAVRSHGSAYPYRDIRKGSRGRKTFWKHVQLVSKF